MTKRKPEQLLPLAESSLPDGPPMTKAERADLGRIVRKRERLLKVTAAQRKAELLADFERQMATLYTFDRNEIWKAAMVAADKAATEAQAAVDAECDRMGIPKEFRPRINAPGWSYRGENTFKERRNELRRVAVARLAAMEKAAHTVIETDSLRLQTELVAHGLGTEAAKAFLQGVGPVDEAMPKLAIGDIETLLTDERSKRGY